MRDYRDAKTTAQILREALAAKHHKITAGEILELIAKLFGMPDWKYPNRAGRFDGCWLQIAESRRVTPAQHKNGSQLAYDVNKAEQAQAVGPTIAFSNEHKKSGSFDNKTASTNWRPCALGGCS